jgi:hypothetical protein
MNKNLDELLLYESSVPVIVQRGEYLLCSLRGLLLGVPLKTGGQRSRGLHWFLFNYYIKKKVGMLGGRRSRWII